MGTRKPSFKNDHRIVYWLAVGAVVFSVCAGGAIAVVLAPGGVNSHPALTGCLIVGCALGLYVLASPILNLPLPGPRTSDPPSWWWFIPLLSILAVLVWGCVYGITIFRAGSIKAPEAANSSTPSPKPRHGHATTRPKRTTAPTSAPAVTLTPLPLPTPIPASPRPVTRKPAPSTHPTAAVRQTLAPMSPTPSPFRESLLEVRVTGSPSAPDQVFGTVKYNGPVKAEGLCIWWFAVPQAMSPSTHFTFVNKQLIQERINLWPGQTQTTGSMGNQEKAEFNMPASSTPPPVGSVYVYTAYVAPDGVWTPEEDAFSATGDFFYPVAVSTFGWRPTVLAEAQDSCRPL